MIIWGINLFILAIGILILGLIKPNWFLFWLDKPNRFIIVGIAMILFMAGAVMFAEGNKQGEPLSEVVQTEKPVVTESPADLAK